MNYLHLLQCLFGNQILLGSVNAAPRDFRDALKHLGELSKSQPELIRSLVTSRVPPESALWHYSNRQPQGIKSVVVYEEL